MKKKIVFLLTLLLTLTLAGAALANTETIDIIIAFQGITILFILIISARA